MAVIEQVFGFFMPRVTLIGVGAHKEIPARIKALGATKPLIVTDKGITRCGITGMIEKMLQEAKMNYAVYDDTIPNPTDENVANGVKAYKDNGCDALITLGGELFPVGRAIANRTAVLEDYETTSYPPYQVYAFYSGIRDSVLRRVLLTVDENDKVVSFLAEEMPVVP